MIYPEVVKKDKKSFDSVIYYNDLKHIYYNVKEKIKYKSVTSILSSLKDKFIPTPSKTYKTQLLYSITHEEVLELWSKKLEFSKLRGTYIHYVIEEMLINKHSLPYMKKNFVLDEELINILKYIKKQSFYKKCYRTEFIIYNVKYKLAGQIDLLVLYKDSFEIHDWKTNQKELTSSNGKFKITNEDDSSYNEYTYQLSIYAYMIELLFKIKCKGLYLHHFKGKDDIKKMKLKYKKNIIKKILNEYFKKN